MANKSDLRIAVVKEGLKTRTSAVIQALDNAQAYVAELTDAQDGATSLAWSRILYGLADTGSVTLTVTVGSPNAVISCLTGANLFDGFTVGRDVQITSFVNAGNNKTTEILAQTSDSITVINTGMVNETDASARCQVNPTAVENGVVDDVVSTKAQFPDLTTTQRDALTDWIW